MLRLRSLLGDASFGAVVLAAAVPLIFLHTHYQPRVSVGSVDADLTDFAILAVVCTAIAIAVREGVGGLAAGVGVWASAAVFLALVLVSIAWARAIDHAYPVTTNVISALKFCEYALLAPAATLILRRADDRRVVFFTAAGWAAVMAVVAIMQFLGYVNQLDGHKPNGREPALLGEHDFAAFAGAALVLAIAGILLRRERTLATLGGIGGALGVSIAAALDSVAGMWLSLGGAWLLVRRQQPSRARIVATVALCAVVTVGAVTLRGAQIGSFLRFLGIESSNQQTTSNVQTYAHRTLLAYIGIEIWLHHPIAGVGWQASKLPHAFDPFLAGARKHFGAKEPREAFPSPQHMWGVQNGVIQVLSDLGLVGLAALLALVVAVVRTVRAASVRAPPGRLFELTVAVGWIVFGAADITGSGLLAGLTGESQMWLGIGLLVALAAEARAHEGTVPR